MSSKGKYPYPFSVHITLTRAPKLSSKDNGNAISIANQNENCLHFLRIKKEKKTENWPIGHSWNKQRQ